MSRQFAQLRVTMWTMDDGWRALTPEEQHLYMAVVTSPELTLTGVMNWRPRRLAQLAAGWTAEAVERTGAALARKGWLVIDDGTEEVFAPHFVVDDGVLKSPKTAAALVANWRLVYSPRLRHEIARAVTNMRHSLNDSVLAVIGPLVEAFTTHTPADTPTDAPADEVADTLCDTPSEALPEGVPGHKQKQTTDSRPHAPNGASDEPAANEHPETTQALVADWLDHCKTRPPQRVIGQLSKEIKNLLDEGFSAEVVRLGIVQWVGRGLHPSTLASVVNEVVNSAPRPIRGQAATDDLFARSAARLANPDASPFALTDGRTA